jgi:demethylspheroidene O-methyltransferase
MEVEQGNRLEGLLNRLYRLKVNLFASERFHNYISRIPVVKYLINYEGGRIYDIMAGFVYSQVLHSIVELDLLKYLMSGGKSISEISRFVDISEDRLRILLRGACALKLISHSKNRYWLSRMGSQIVGIPGLLEMISHNQLLYNDLQDPVGLLKGKENTNLSHFWPYVQKSRDKSDISEKNSVQYSKLMQTSQRLVAKETLDTYSLARFKNILDLGGGTGAFLSEVDKRYPQMSRTLFDLPNVIKEAKSNASKDKYLADINFIGGSFLVDTIPLGFELITLVRVLYDHEDHTAELILKRIFESLPSSGKLLITEPMSGGSNPSKSSDCYFSFYTMAMTTGKVRSFEEHKAILLRVGFSNIKKHNGSAPFITQVITAEK